MAKQYKITKSFTYEGQRYYVRGDTESEVEVKKAMKIRDLKEGKITVNAAMSVKDWCEICIRDYKSNLAPVTLANYKSKVNHWIVSKIGNLRVKDVKEIHCQGILNEMSANNMADHTMRKVAQIMRFIFERAKRNHLIIYNPAEDLTIPSGGGKSTRRAITASERKHILTVAASNPKYIYFLFMLYCGCRPSEAAEIKGMDITSIGSENVLHIRGTKTDNADRIVPIPDKLFAVLPQISPFDYFVTNENGGKLSAGNRNVLWKHFRRDLNIEMGCKVYRNQLVPPYPVAPDLTPYCLRHTYCTDLQKMGIDIRTAQYLMGHADIRMTANIYTHTDDETVVAAAQKMKECDTPCCTQASNH